MVKVGLFREKSSDNPDTVFNRSFILTSVRYGPTLVLVSVFVQEEFPVLSTNTLRKKKLGG